MENAGKLRQRITVMREQDVADGAGGYDRSWVAVATNIPAQVLCLNGRESVIGHVLQGVSYFEIMVRYRTDIQVSDQIRWEGRELNVHAAEDRLGTRRWTVINASTLAPQGA